MTTRDIIFAGSSRLRDAVTLRGCDAAIVLLAVAVAVSFDTLLGSFRDSHSHPSWRYRFPNYFPFHSTLRDTPRHRRAASILCRSRQVFHLLYHHYPVYTYCGIA